MASVIRKDRHYHGSAAIICDDCGKLIKEAIKGITIKTPYCSNCNKRIEDARQNYCGYCGEPLNWGKAE